MYEELKKKMLENVLEALVTGNSDKLSKLADETTELRIRVMCESIMKQAVDLRETAAVAPRDTLKERMIHAAETLEQAAAVIMAGGEVLVDGRDNH